ncbi:MAG: hypothetical protein QOH40_310 [Arthrobacter pascens]|jgi:ketosteroid isomerase-like protein|nr:hypothetical protein [Arthrobacter pascens]
MTHGAALAIGVNECISARDVEGLAHLMSEDHTFVDTAGTAVIGRAACLDAWRGFFDAFPGYRNVFKAVTTTGHVVAITGHSVCPGHPELEGPALWTAVIRGDRLSEWRVYADTVEARRRLGLEGD